MIINKKNWLYYLLFLFIGYFIYNFQIEKSFNLFTIYVLCISFNFIGNIFKLNPKKLLPALFGCSLFLMYGVSYDNGSFHLQFLQFFILLSIFALLLVALISNFKLQIKKIIVVVFGIVMAMIYLIKEDKLAEYKYIPFVISSFFMFRTISFLYEIKYLKKEVSRIDKINYFLLTPNFSMPLFPIVDYKTFINSYEGITTNTLRRSVLLICKGVFQLLLYRFIYHLIIIPFDEIQTALQVFIFLVANFLIVLRVIGAFHIAIGLIILSGYNIPDIFNNIFFSTGFSNLWRRTNMYWRNFMIKIFYYPIYFKIKKLGIYTALIISTFLSFFITWILHTYQWFWLKGTFPLEIKDAIFWGSFGLLVSINTLIQQKELDRSGSKINLPFPVLRQAFSGLIVLLVMSVLWSIWTCNSLESWWTVVKNIRNINFEQLKIILLLCLCYLFIAGVYHFYQNNAEHRFTFFQKQKNALSYTGFIVLLLTLFVLSKQKNFPVRIIPIITEKLNKADLTVIDNGYYTNLISTNNYSSQIWVNDNDITKNWTKYITSKTTTSRNDLMLTDNIPNASVKYNGINFTLNDFGLRDKNYPKNKPDSSYRIIILGGSYECGNGINDGEDFISLVESELNNHYSATMNNKPVHIELINFSVNGYRLFQRLYLYKDNARYWNPDAVLLFIHSNYRLRVCNYVNRLVNSDNIINDPYLKNIVEMTGIAKNDGGMTVKNKLGNFADSLNFFAVNKMCLLAKEDSANLIAVYLPAIKDKGSIRDSIFMADICSINNINQISLSDVYAGQNKKELSLSDVDFHPNKKATGLIANKLLEKILLHQDYFNIKFTKK